MTTNCHLLWVYMYWYCGSVYQVSASHSPPNPYLGCSVYNLPSLLLMTDWNYNGVIRVQTYKNGVRQPLRIWSQDVSLHHWEPDISLTCPRSGRTGLALFRATIPASCILVVLRSPLFNCAAILDPAYPYLIGTLIRSNYTLFKTLMYLVALPHKPHPSCSPVGYHSQLLLESVSCHSLTKL